MPYWIDKATRKLAIAPRPRGGDWLEDDLRALQREGVQILVSMLTPGEEQELGLTQEANLCTAVGLELRRFPIPDREVPARLEEFKSFLLALRQEHQAGRSIAAHCRAGIGRSSLLLASLLCIEGESTDQAFAAISQARGVRVPDTQEQVAFVTRLQSNLHG